MALRDCAEDMQVIFKTASSASSANSFRCGHRVESVQLQHDG